eukprot:TRINITY_DN3352_c1_g1_i1.p1 TRINITY_DN3352_c1_g1~~TRINITY_DN3352_c1_g1_i1.p1  ORF type:complete len:1202 (+),score=491.63 TRINITY_DN3352_c1_g1_i1:58-3663(+)
MMEQYIAALQKRSNFQVEKNESRNTIIIAAVSDDLELLENRFEAIRDMGGDPLKEATDCNSQGLTPLAIACALGHKKIVIALLEAKVSASECDHMGRTPMHFAVANDKPQIVSILLEACGRALTMFQDRAYRNTPVHLAATLSSATIFEMLLDSQPEAANIKNKLGHTPLHVACLLGSVEVVNAFLDSEAHQMDVSSISEKDKKEMTPLMLACQFGRDQCVAPILAIVEFDHLTQGDENGMTAMHWAAYNGHAACLKTLLSFRESIQMTRGGSIKQKPRLRELMRVRDDSHRSLLHLAAYAGRLEVVSLLKKVHPNTFTSSLFQYDDQKRTPLFYTVPMGQKKMMHVLLTVMLRTPPLHDSRNRNSDDTNQPLTHKDAQGFTVLQWICILNKPQMFEIFQDFQPGDWSVDGVSLLHLSAYYGSSAVCKALVDNYSENPFALDHRRRSAVDIALTRGHVEIAEMFLKTNMKTKKEVESLFSSGKITRKIFHNICLGKSAKSLDYLFQLEKMAGIGHGNVWARDAVGRLPLHYAAFSENPEIVKNLLIFMFQDENAKTFKDLKDHDHVTPIMLSAMTINPSHVPSISTLMDLYEHSGSKPDFLGRTWIHYACLNPYSPVTVLQILLDDYSESHTEAERIQLILAKDRDGNSGIHYLCKNTKIENKKEFNSALEIFFKCGKTFRNRKGWSPLHVAVHHENLVAMQTLLSRDPEMVHVRDNQGRIPMHVASFYGKSDAIYLLHQKQSHINSQDENGKTPLHHAAVGGRENSVEILLKFPNIGINILDKKKRNALCSAILSPADTETVKHVVLNLIENSSIDLNSQDSHGRTPLMMMILHDAHSQDQLQLENEVESQLRDVSSLTEISLKSTRGFEFDVNLQDEKSRTAADYVTYFSEKFNSLEGSSWAIQLTELLMSFGMSSSRDTSELPSFEIDMNDHGDSDENSSEEEDIDDVVENFDGNVSEAQEALIDKLKSRMNFDEISPEIRAHSPPPEIVASKISFPEDEKIDGNSAENSPEMDESENETKVEEISEKIPNQNQNLEKDEVENIPASKPLMASRVSENLFQVENHPESRAKPTPTTPTKIPRVPTEDLESQVQLRAYHLAPNSSLHRLLPLVELAENLLKTRRNLDVELKYLQEMVFIQARENRKSLTDVILKHRVPPKSNFQDEFNLKNSDKDGGYLEMLVGACFGLLMTVTLLSLL